MGTSTDGGRWDDWDNESFEAQGQEHHGRTKSGRGQFDKIYGKDLIK